MQILKERITQAILPFLKQKGVEADVMRMLEYPPIPANGDLSFPCFKLASTLRNAPPKIAAELKAFIDSGEAIQGIARIETVGAYLNFFAEPSYFAESVKRILETERFGSNESGKGKTICIDYSSPNIAKRFHVGHLGTTVIGNAIKKIHQFCGYECIGINHLGDWGTQFGKLIIAYKRWSNAEKVKERGIDELVDLYVRFCAEAETNDSLNDEARDAFAKLESFDKEYMEIWQYFKDISLAEYMKTYDLLGISFESYNGESFYNDKMDAVVASLREKGLLTMNDGASIVELEEYGMPPALILKKDGATLYATRDITAAIWRKQNYDFHKCLYVTSAGQSLHFAQYFKVLELMGYDWATDLVHIPYGTMSIGGEKLASRTGNVVLLDDLFAEAIRKARVIIEEKNVDLKDKDATARAVGVGAVVFWALSNSRIKDTNFSWEESLSFDGSTGPYVQYTYARACSILRKAEGTGNVNADYSANASETALIKALNLFPEKVAIALKDYEPSTISRYALDLCSEFNKFYHDCAILREEGETKQFRLALVKATVNVLGSCLDLLGIQRTEEI